jgi:hypothetical protein
MNFKSERIKHLFFKTQVGESGAHSNLAMTGVHRSNRYCPTVSNSLHSFYFSFIFFNCHFVSDCDALAMIGTWVCYLSVIPSHVVS